MFYYITYNHIKFPDNVDETSTTFLIGSMLWWFTASLLWSPHVSWLVDSNFITHGMKMFFQWLVIIDIVTLALQLDVLHKDTIPPINKKDENNS